MNLNLIWQAECIFCNENKNKYIDTSNIELRGASNKNTKGFPFENGQAGSAN